MSLDELFIMILDIAINNSLSVIIAFTALLIVVTLTLKDFHLFYYRFIITH